MKKENTLLYLSIILGVLGFILVTFSLIKIAEGHNNNDAIKELQCRFHTYEDYSFVLATNEQYLMCLYEEGVDR